MDGTFQRIFEMDYLAIFPGILFSLFLDALDVIWVSRKT